MRKTLIIALVLLTVLGMAVSAGGGKEGARAATRAPKLAAIAVLHPYFAPMETAAKDFAAATGVHVEYRATQDFDQEQQNVIVDGMLALGYNGFAMWPGHPESVNATIAELKDRGIPAILIAGQAKLPTPAALCIATDVAKSAATGAELLIQAMGGRGNIVNLLGELSDPNTLLRKAAIEGVVAKYPNVRIIQEISGIDNFEAATSRIDAFLSTRARDVDGMISTAYVATVVNAEALTEIGDKRIKFIGIDDDPKVLEAIRQGYVTGTMSQAPYIQAYLGLEGVRLLREGYTVKPGKYFIDSGSFLIDRNNVDTYAAKIKSDAVSMQKSFKDDFFDPPKR